MLDSKADKAVVACHTVQLLQSGHDQVLFESFKHALNARINSARNIPKRVR